MSFNSADCLFTSILTWHRAAQKRRARTARGTRKLLLGKLAELGGSSGTHLLACRRNVPRPSPPGLAQHQPCPQLHSHKGTGVPAGPFCKSGGERSGTTESAGREGGRGPGAWAERRPAGYSQGDRAVGQRVRGQDLRELQAAAHHLALGGARRPAGPSGPPVVLAAQRQRRGPAAASQQREQSQRQQQRRRRASPQALGRLHAAGWAAGRGLPAERQSTGLAGRPGARADGSAARARGRPEPCGGQRARPPPRQHAPLSAAAALGLWVAAGSRPRGSLRRSTAERERRLHRPLPAAAPPRLPPPPPFLLPLLPLLPPSSSFSPLPPLLPFPFFSSSFFSSSSTSWSPVPSAPATRGSGKDVGAPRPAPPVACPRPHACPASGQELWARGSTVTRGEGGRKF